METTINERIKIIVQHSMLTNQKFANKIGVAPATIGNIISGNTEPSNKVVSMIYSNIEGLNKDWLLTGRGEMFIDSKRTKTTSLPAINIETVLDDYRQEIKKKDSIIEKLWREVDAWRDMAMASNPALGKDNATGLPALLHLQSFSRVTALS